LLLPLLMVACQRREKALAQVAGKTLTLNDLQQAVEAVAGRPASQVSPELMAQVFADLLEEEVVLAAGGPEDRALQAGERSRRARELLAQLCPPPPPPSPQEVDQALAQKGEGEAKERLFLRQLLLPSQAQAQEVRERLRKGEDFLSLSRQFSRAANAETGGTIGWVERGQLAPDFEAAVLGLKAGEVSQPVQSDAGWHLFLVEKRELGADPQRRQEVARQLLAQRVEEERKRCLAALAQKVGVKVNCQQAPFPCRNPFQEAQ